MKEIPLINSKNKAKVSDEDYDFIMQWDWYESQDGYAVRPDTDTTGNPCFIEMGYEVLRRQGKVQ